MQKIRKILRADSEKTALPTNQPTSQPTNQPTITNNTDFTGPGWRRSKKNKQFWTCPYNLRYNRTHIVFKKVETIAFTLIH